MNVSSVASAVPQSAAFNSQELAAVQAAQKSEALFFVQADPSGATRSQVLRESAWDGVANRDTLLELGGHKYISYEIGATEHALTGGHSNVLDNRQAFGEQRLFLVLDSDSVAFAMSQQAAAPEKVSADLRSVIDSDPNASARTVFDLKDGSKAFTFGGAIIQQKGDEYLRYAPKDT